jgi:hypothetical protein
LVWAGDYADPEPGGSANLYQLTETRHFRRFDGLVGCDVEPNTTLPPGAKPGVFGYVCNPEKRQYIEYLTRPIDETGWGRTPLPHLTADGGPFCAADDLGTWARDRIYYSQRLPGAGWTAVNHITHQRIGGQK